jgi:hypothetical protein
LRTKTPFNIRLANYLEYQFDSISWVVNKVNKAGLVDSGRRWGQNIQGRSAEA